MSRFCLLVLVLLTRNAIADQYGGVTFTTPDGWRQQPGPDGMQFRAPIPNSTGTVLLTLHPAQARTGDFASAFHAAVEAGTGKGERGVNSGQAQPMRIPNAPPALAQGVILDDSSGRRKYRLFLGFDLGNQINILEGEALEKDAWSRFTPSLVAFVSGLRFGAGPSPATSAPRSEPTPAAGGGLSGWYVGGENSTSFNPNTGNWSFGASYSYYRFFPDGRVYWGWTLPKNETMDAFDRSPDPGQVGNWGTYTISGGRIRMVWKNTARSPENWPFTREAGAITMAGTTYYRIAPCDGLRLSGTWGTSSFAATGRGNGVSGSRTIMFTPDGQFRRQGFTGSVNAGSAVAGTTSQYSSGAGTYRITGNTLELTFSGGYRE
jgi:hypothetical protein